MPLQDWNKSLLFAKQLVSELTKQNITCTYTVYNLYNGRKGIYLNVLDADQRIHDQYASGVWDNFNEMKIALTRLKQQIINEHN